MCNNCSNSIRITKIWDDTWGINLCLEKSQVSNNYRVLYISSSFGLSELSHIAFLKQRKKELLANLSKFTKWQLGTILSENNCHYLFVKKVFFVANAWCKCKMQMQDANAWCKCLMQMPDANAWCKCMMQMHDAK